MIINNYNPFSLSGKTILITGASSGIGRSIAIECSKIGATVVITARDSVRLQETLSMLSGEGHQSIQADLTDTNDLDNLSKSTPLIDGLVNNAGCNRRMLCQYIKESDMNLVMQTNLISPVLLTKNLLKGKKIKAGGSIVFTSSIAAFHSSIGDSVYSASKGGLISYARVLAMELSPKKIRVNSILPGMVKTHLMENGPLAKEDYEIDEKKYPLGRYGESQDVAFTAVYLLSDATRWMTGSSIVIDGGISLT